MIVSTILMLLPVMTSLPSACTGSYVFPRSAMADSFRRWPGSNPESEGADTYNYQYGGKLVEDRRDNTATNYDVVTFLKEIKLMTPRDMETFQQKARGWRHYNVRPGRHDTTHPKDSWLTHDSQTLANDFLGDFQEELRHRKHSLAMAEWNFLTNLTQWNSHQVSIEQSTFSNWWKTKVDDLRVLRYEPLQEPVNRQIKMALTVSMASQNDSVTQKVSSLQTGLLNVYSTTTLCLREMQGKCVGLQPELQELMATSRDPNVLEEAWLKWRHVTGGVLKDRYTELIALLNEMARENDYADYSQFEKTQAFFETPELEELQERLWEQVTPLYLHLHAYVRRRLGEVYGVGVVGKDGTIAAHLLGNMWAQNWVEIYDIVAPYQEVDVDSDLDTMMSSRNDVTWMFSLAEDFYKSLGLPSMPASFWERSVFSKPNDRPMDCNARTFDMFYHNDVRIKMCARPDTKSLMAVFHEMGHIAYCIAYRHQPTVFRTGASLATHEAIGDMAQLLFLASRSQRNGRELEDEKKEEAVVGVKENEDEDEENIDVGLKEKEMTYVREHDKTLGKGKNGINVDMDKEQHLSKKEKVSINRLMKQALEKVAFLPFGLLVDKWRYGVMRASITSDGYNEEWWKLRLQYQGIRAPSPRSEADFDPGAKYHVIANSMFSGYFLAQFQQFQMMFSLCQDKGDESSYQTRHNRHNAQELSGPLDSYHCNISNEMKHKFRRFLSHGSSLPWQQQMKELTGEATVTSDAILTHFRPLHQWLRRENAKAGDTIGWKGASINWKH